MSESKGWYAIDLDGSLAEYDVWRGEEHIGEPVPKMLERVKQWITEGKEVRVLTARAHSKENIKVVREWLDKNGLPEVGVTNKKDFQMIELWDDRCVQVIPNTGMSVKEFMLKWTESLGDKDMYPLNNAGSIMDVSDICRSLESFFENVNG